MRAYVVTGIMRSGTSFLAQTLHELGVPMGNMMRFPPHPEAALDWEDVDFSDELAAAIVSGKMDVRTFLRGYVEARGEGPWGVKSPFLLPFVSQLKGILGEDLKVFLTKRDTKEAYLSLGRQTKHLKDGLRVAIRGIQQELDDSWMMAFDHADEVFECEESRQFPERVRERLRLLVKG